MWRFKYHIMKRVDLSRAERVKEFVEVARTKTCDVILKHDKWVVDGKSILGIFSLNLSTPVDLYTEDYTGFEEFIVD